MTRKIYLCLAAVAACVISLCMGCSSDEQYSNETESLSLEEKVHVAKSKLLNMAKYYNLSGSIDEQELARLIQSDSLNWDTVKVRFSQLAEIHGYYRNIIIANNHLKFDSRKERLRKKRRETIPTRDVYTYRGDFSASENGVSFDASWQCNSDGQGTVDVSNVYVYNVGFCEHDPVTDAVFTLSGSVSITFSFKVYGTGTSFTSDWLVNCYYWGGSCSVSITPPVEKN